MPELCKYVAMEMLERYRQMLFTSWPSAVFDTLAQASIDNIDFRATLCKALATQTFLESPSWTRSPRLRSLADDDPEIVFELMDQKDRLIQSYRDRAKRLAFDGRSDQFGMLSYLEMELSGHDPETMRFLEPRGKRLTTWKWGHSCGGAPVLNLVSGRASYWHGNRWVEYSC